MRWQVEFRAICRQGLENAGTRIIAFTGVKNDPQFLQKSTWIILRRPHSAFHG